ncbi:MAG TPA: hypothetical protein VFR87_17425 [Nocardioidaceae bacterium]|nr:hypothetical protein [Nocardioidaceae bacterium]
MDGGDRLERQELEATLEVRRELGPSYEPALVDSFVDRIERAVEARVDARIAERRAERKRADERSNRQLSMGITSMALGIPISAIAGGIGDVPGLVVSWAGIAAVNLAYAWQNRTGDRP